MSRFGNTLFSGNRFIFWSLGPVLLVSGLTFVGLAVWVFPSGGQVSRLGTTLIGLFCLLCVPVLYDPTKFWLAGRVVTAVVFLSYLWYCISEWVWHSDAIGLVKPRGMPTPLNATLGLLVIGLPCLWWTLFGRFSLRKLPGSVPGEAVVQPADIVFQTAVGTSRGEDDSVASLGDMIRACRERFGEPPRRMSRDEQEAFQIEVSWFYMAVLNVTGDDLRLILRHQDVLRDSGRVVWGCLVQANNAPSNRRIDGFCLLTSSTAQPVFRRHRYPFSTGSPVVFLN